MSELADEAQAYYRAMRGEFVLDQSAHDTIKENAKTTIINLVPNALQELQHLMEHAESETVRWNAAKYILETGMFGKSPDEDELDRLVRSMRAKPMPDPAPTE